MIRTQVKSLALAVAATIVLAASVQAESLALSSAEAMSSDGLSIVYDPDTGHVFASAPDGEAFTALQLESASSSFTSQCAAELAGVFDLCTPDRVFHLDVGGFSSIDFGPILGTGIDGVTLLADLSVDGANLGGGFNTGSGVILVHPDFAVPEPASVLTLALGGCCWLASLRRRTRAC